MDLLNDPDFAFLFFTGLGLVLLIYIFLIAD